ncbi:MAG: hypothetical protein ACW99G_04865 [Candidatus Thorarchaeota archaeon]|jgi:hypothetical protein
MKFPGWKKIGVTFGFVGLQVLTVGAVGVLSYLLGTIPFLKTMWFTELQLEQGINTFGFTATGFLSLLCILFVLLLCGLAGFLIYKWGEWSHEFADDWLADREWRKARALERRVQQADRAIAEGAQLPSWEA